MHVQAREYVGVKSERHLQWECRKAMDDIKAQIEECYGELFVDKLREHDVLDYLLMENMDLRASLSGTCVYMCFLVLSVFCLDRFR